MRIQLHFSVPLPPENYQNETYWTVSVFCLLASALSGGSWFHVFLLIYFLGKLYLPQIINVFLHTPWQCLTYRHFLKIQGDLSPLSLHTVMKEVVWKSFNMFQFSSEVLHNLQITASLVPSTVCSLLQWKMLLNLLILANTKTEVGKRHLLAPCLEVGQPVSDINFQFWYFVSFCSLG